MSLAPSTPVYDRDRTFLSRWSPGPLRMRVLDYRGEPSEADALPVLTFTSDLPDTEFTPVIPTVEREGLDYIAFLPSTATETPGPYLGTWEYQVGGVARVGQQPLVVGEASPAYDALPWGMQSLVDTVWLRMADMFDSPLGGPHLQVYVQSHFGRERIAQLLPVALGRLNLVAQPHQTYSLDQKFPLDRWGALLELGLWIEVIRHMIRSYTEQPQVVGTQVARLDRNQYVTQWRALLNDHEADFKSMLDGFKIASMNLGAASVRVSGGLYPRMGAGASVTPLSGAPRGLFVARGY